MNASLKTDLFHNFNRLATGTLIAAGAFFFSLDAPAQFGGLNVGGKGREAAASGVDSYATSVEELVSGVAVARVAFMEAQGKLIEALELKKEAAIKLAEATQAVKGAATTSDKVAALKASSKVSAEADTVLKDGMEKKEELSSESKEKFGEGAAKFAEGSMSEKKQIETIQNLAGQGTAMAKSGNPQEIKKAKGLVDQVTTLSSFVPGDFKEGLSTLSSIMKFAKKQNITIPNEDEIAKLLGENP